MITKIHKKTYIIMLASRTPVKTCTYRECHKLCWFSITDNSCCVSSTQLYCMSDKNRVKSNHLCPLLHPLSTTVQYVYLLFRHQHHLANFLLICWQYQQKLPCHFQACKFTKKSIMIHRTTHWHWRINCWIKDDRLDENKGW